MFSHKSLVLTVALSLVFSGPAASQQDPGTISTLPSLQTEVAVAALADLIDAQTVTSERGFLSLDVPRAEGQPQEERFVEENTMFLMFERNVSEREMRDYITSNDIILLRVFPEIAAIEIRADLGIHLEPRPTDSDANHTVLRGLAEAIVEYESDPLIRHAAPGVLLHGQRQPDPNDSVLPSTNLYAGIYETNPSDPNEVADWGIADIEADQLWELTGGRDGALLGVLDVGFARHEDLVFLELSPNVPPHNHGNHVAGIACARHNDRGVRGVLPNCMVRAQPLDLFFFSGQGDDIDRFYVTFAQIIRTLTTFVESQDDVSTFNVSLGYNWRPNFNINPDLPESKSERARSLVEAQGAFLVPLLEAAAGRGKVVFSAAGNDSQGLAEPVAARYASPFNWAALEAGTVGVANGVIVEAHDQNGDRATFSNVGGHISCPGVNILSSLALGPDGMPSDAVYGRTAGTSMASPYCAAGLVLFRLTKPTYSGVEAIECMLQSSEVSTSGTPMLKLTEAGNVCP